MARMVPEHPADTASGAEQAVFARIRDELSSDWIALHSVGLTIHQAKPWAEIDFVLVGPPGVFCLEVKGGLVEREDGIWYTTPQGGPKAGKRQQLKESPFEQVGSAAAELFHFLETRLPKITKVITGYAVAAPDVDWNIRGPDIDRALVLDQVDSLQLFSDCMAKVTRRWAEKVGTNWNKKLDTLGRSEKLSVLDSIRGDFQLVPSLRATAGIAGRELVRLTEEQCALFGRLAHNPRVIASGGAGTGKTVIALEEARRLAHEGHRVLYTCYSRNLAGHVRSRLLDEPAITARTLHGLMMDLVAAAGRAGELPNASDDDVMSLFLPELALEVLLPTIEEPAFDIVVVDEGQDLLRDAYLDVIEALVGGNLNAGRWRIFLDPNQNIFGGVAPSALKRMRDTRAVEWPLTVNCRNTAPIATQVSLLSGVPLPEVLATSGPDVELIWYEADEDQRASVEGTLRRLRSDGFRPEQIVVLSRHLLKSSVLRDAGPNFVDVSRGQDQPAPTGVRFSTVASFKGLEAEVILLVDVDDLSTNEGLSSVYVGASRAKVALVVFIAAAEKERFQDLAKEFGRSVVERTA